jgi:hypothetical protein
MKFIAQLRTWEDDQNVFMDGGKPWGVYGIVGRPYRVFMPHEDGTE